MLWSLDDYWYYSLFTLVMLVVFESTVVTSRMRNLDEMRELATPPSAALGECPAQLATRAPPQGHLRPLLPASTLPCSPFLSSPHCALPTCCLLLLFGNGAALRDGKWTALSSEDLLPGDIIALSRAEGHPAYSYNGALAEVEAACPADVVLLHGSVTVNESALTGESTPMLKMPLEAAVAEENPDGGGGGGGGGSRAAAAPSSGGAAPLSFSGHRASVVLGGTKILQHSAGTQPASLQPLGGGAVGYVLRTGFYSSPGELIRTILFASERASENSRETLVFIIVLLAFAFAAAAYVLMHGLADPTRSRWRLLLHCTMILTSVVPPELPMELSLAVNNSLLALHKLGIYCTEPFRIPYAGRCHVCCFDKTGTLTLSDLIVEGVAVATREGVATGSGAGDTAAAAPQTPPSKAAAGKATAAEAGAAEAGGARFGMTSAAQAPLEAAFVLAGCHQLVASGGKLLGDPMERAALLAAGWGYHADETAVRELPLQAESLPLALRTVLPQGHGAVRPTLQILKRFPFSSDLKRSSAVVHTGLALGGTRVEPSSRVAAAARACGAYGLRVIAKGSPEAVRAMLDTVPVGYDATYMRYASSGKRVLALASKALPDGGTHAAPAIKRHEAERGLTFCGFLVLHCPARPESREVLHALSASGHTLQMLTGDSLLTATHTAHALGLATKPALLLQLEGPTPAAEDGAAQGGVREAGSSPAPKAVRTPIEKYISARLQRSAALKGSSSAAAAATAAAAAAAAAAASAPSMPASARLRWAAWEPEAPSLDVGATAYPPGTLPPGGYLPEDLSPSMFRELARRFDLCIGGDGFAALQRRRALAAALPYVRVLARMSPAQKEVALATLAEGGLVTMMCGDGTNDVGALKQSAVGVALVSTSLVAPPPPPPPASGGGSKGSGSAADGAGSGKGTPAERQRRRLEERMAQEMASAPTVKLGDASIAAAFTARSASVTSCVDVITQGR